MKNSRAAAAARIRPICQGESQVAEYAIVTLLRLVGKPVLLLRTISDGSVMGLTSRMSAVPGVLLYRPEFIRSFKIPSAADTLLLIEFLFDVTIVTVMYPLTSVQLPLV
jgi:hypothetical protein